MALYRTNGENVLTETHPESRAIRKARVVYRLSYLHGVCANVDAANAAARMCKIGQLNPWHASESFASMSATKTQEISSYFNTGDDDGDEKQFLPGTGSMTIMDNAAVENTIMALVHTMKCTLKFTNFDTAEEYYIYWKVFLPGEDSTFLLKNIVYLGGKTDQNSTISAGTELWTILEGYPGMRKITLGPNSANGLPNIGYADVYCNVDEMREKYMSQMSPNGAYADSAASVEFEHWMMPHPFPDSQAHNILSDSYKHSPVVVFYCLVQDTVLGGYKVPAETTISNFGDVTQLGLEGKMVKHVSIQRGLASEVFISSNTQYDLVS